LGRAHVVVGVDTGLTHLAAAFNVPTVGVYCATDPAATGLYASGSARVLNLGGVNAPPAVADVIAAIEHVGAA
jgi:heptosyltransferase-1